MHDGELKGLIVHKAGLFGRLEKTKDIRGYIGCGIKKVSDFVPEEEYHGTYEAVSKAFRTAIWKQKTNASETIYTSRKSLTMRQATCLTG